MKILKKYINDYFIILGLSVLLFGIVDLMSYWRDPINERPLIVNVKLASVVIIFSVILFIIVDFFIPFHRRRLIKKLNQQFTNSKLIDPLNLKIKVNNQISILFYAGDTILKKSKITFEYEESNSNFFENLIKEQSVIQALENCKYANSEFKKISNSLTQLSIELIKYSN